jgi:2-oxoglutarate ferredoxin oxidoreductase subunit alpha
LTDDAISPRVKMGTKNGDHIATSYEHDEHWATSEDPDMKMKMTEKRARKIAKFYEDQDFRWYEIINPEAKKYIIASSFTCYTAKIFIEKNPEYGLVIIKFLKPLDERLVADLEGKEEIIFFENNHGGQLEKHMTDDLKLDQISGLKISNYRKYDLYPFYMEDFENRLLTK